MRFSQPLIAKQAKTTCDLFDLTSPAFLTTFQLLQNSRPMGKIFLASYGLVYFLNLLRLFFCSDSVINKKYTKTPSSIAISKYFNFLCFLTLNNKYFL